MFDIQLNSFVRRVEKKDELKALIKSSGAKLNRKGRSRHWRLQGNWQQFEIIIQHAHIKEEPSWQWVIEKLNGYKPKPQMDELVSIVKRNPAITLQKLIAQTDCTLIEARKAFDIAAWE
ncbi:ribosome recycling factor family protein [Pseudoalteromonas luteoviolacea]|uniref:ribosome recycling factor family protein n=1 Tax=Pseudoalteromonas luteoviolacea TaxID=43657 RepID=UPI0007B03EED|nr:ribosome recycling factor family protein [Pseudoalteromonas luteoviolacea]